MNLSAEKTAYFQLHTAILLFGFTAILGRLIDMTEIEIVWYRMGITALTLLFFPGITRQLSTVPIRDILRMAGIGVVITIHWLSFFGSIKYANVTVALAVFSTSALFTSFLEPLLYRTRIKWTEILLGAMVIPGIFLIFTFGETYLTGILLALVSAALGSLFSIMNRQMVAHYPARTITFIELATGWLLLSVLAPFYMAAVPEATFIPSMLDWLYLLILAVLCTTVAFQLSVNSLRHITAFTFNLSINLEPVYGILMAAVLFKEQQEIPSGFYAGTGIILLAVLSHAILQRRVKKG
jgi:drug/metabolite transporter (DMT)-like permease